MYTCALVYTLSIESSVLQKTRGSEGYFMSKAAKWPCMQRRTILLHDDAGHHVPYGFHVPSEDTHSKATLSEPMSATVCNSIRLASFRPYFRYTWILTYIDPSIIHPKLYLQISRDSTTVINTCSSRTPFARVFHHSRCWFSIFTEQLEWLVELCQLLQSNTMVFIPHSLVATDVSLLVKNIKLRHLKIPPWSRRHTIRFAAYTHKKLDGFNGPPAWINSWETFSSAYHTLFSPSHLPKLIIFSFSGVLQAFINDLAAPCWDSVLPSHRSCHVAVCLW